MKSDLFSALVALAFLSFGFNEAHAQKAVSHSSFGGFSSSEGGVLGTIGNPSQLALDRVPQSGPVAPQPAAQTPQVFYREASQASSFGGKASTGGPSPIGSTAENPILRLMDLVQRECAANPSSAHCQALQQQQQQTQTVASACGGTKRGGEEIFQRGSGGNPGYAGSCGRQIGAHVQCHSCSAHWEYINADLLRCVCD